MTTENHFEASRKGIELWCRRYVSNLLDITIEKVEAGAEFDRFGLDSAMAVAMILELEEQIGREVSPSLLFEYPTIAGLAAHLAEAAGKVEAAA